MANPSVKSEAQAASPPSFSCELTAWNVTRLSLSDLANLRKTPEVRLPPHITAPFLKNSDDQTVASLVAIYAGIDSLGQGRETYRDWGIVSASQFIGRGSFAATLYKYCKDGPWGVSVQVIPHNMLHSISSTISLTLPCVGPCLGAGGGVNGEFDALLIAVNLLAGGQIPGVWVTWSVWDPELIIDEAGKPKSESTCIAAALALTPLVNREPFAQLDLRRIDPIRIPDSAHVEYSGENEGPVSKSLMNALHYLCEKKPQTLQVKCPIQGGLELDLRWRSRDAALPPNSEQMNKSTRQGTDANI